MYMQDSVEETLYTIVQGYDTDTIVWRIQPRIKAGLASLIESFECTVDDASPSRSQGANLLPSQRRERLWEIIRQIDPDIEGNGGSRDRPGGWRDMLPRAKDWDAWRSSLKLSNPLLRLPRPASGGLVAGPGRLPPLPAPRFH
jgi:hypothetical protein